MLIGNVCVKHPELGGRRYNGGNCIECVKAAKAAYRARHKDRISQEMREYRQANPERIKELNAKWRAANKQKIREINLRRVGFTPDLFASALSLQKGECAICRTPLSKLPNKQIHADHCHATATPRGVLCHHCNAGLGAFRDSAQLLTAAIGYLSKPTLERKGVST